MAPAIEIGNRRRECTWIKLVMVTMILMILAAIAIPWYQNSVLRAKETSLKANLFQLREAIEQYTADRKASPQSLEDLIDRGYLREVPYDPITESQNTWRFDASVGPDSDSPQTGIGDIHSGSIGVASDGTRYNDW